MAAEPANPGSDAASLELFESKIRPVLVRECYGCHSAAAIAEGKLRGGLRLDTREATRSGGDSGPSVVPGDPAASLLINALKQEDFEMPPKGKLPDSVIADFSKWIELGAADPREGKSNSPVTGVDIQAGRDFWSFQPLNVEHTTTDVGTPEHGWAKTAIDIFISKKHAERGLAPNPIAEPRILVRRAWFDLLGLPPSPEEMSSWVMRLQSTTKSDGTESPFNYTAWSELIDHLLTSPQYGERWARHWMDIARFAESHGYEQDYDRTNAYHYRDFLIHAFNDDLPYDKFIQWQLAGDELLPNNPLAWMATGFLGGGAFPTQLTETEFESARYDELDDMVATTGVAFLGLSVGCARCHDHKFDPIPTADYYRMAAVFSKTIRSEHEFDLDPEENQRRIVAYQTKLAELKQSLKNIEANELPTLLRTWLGDPSRGIDGANDTSQWRAIAAEVRSSAATIFAVQPDGSFLATGKPPAQEVVTCVVKLQPQSVGAIRLEALAHDTLPNKGPGRADNGNFALGNFKASIQKLNAPTSQLWKFAFAAATHQQNDNSLSVAASIDDDLVSGWAVDGQIGKDQAAVFRLAEPIGINEPSELTIELTFNHPNNKHTIGRMRLSIAADPQVPLSVGDQTLSQELATAIERLSKAPVSSDDWDLVMNWFKTTLPIWREAQQAITDFETAGPQPQKTKVLVASEGLPHLPHHADDRGYPHFYPVTHQLRRGDVHQKGDVAEPGFLQVLMASGRESNHWLHEIPDASMRTSGGRSALAQWITDPQHGAGPLAARVMVNRLWQHHFGRGLVATPNDFGHSGEAPSHPELLDYLAYALIAGDWRLKPLHKSIMTSAVYLQSSAVGSSAEGSSVDSRLSVDPHNHFLWRRVPQRLEAEAIRDAMLSVSGRLDPRMFGPGTLDQSMKRRSVYFFIKRSQLIPMMMLFDWPEHLVSIGQRSSTTIAPQALMFINSPQGREYAEALAIKLPSDKTEQAIESAYRFVYGRTPSDQESRLAGKFIEQQVAARATAGVEESARQALADFCQMLLGSNEFVYVD